MGKLKDNIVIIGMPGCGKSTLGQILSEELKLDFYDMDEYIEDLAKHTIPELFEKGEENFRDWETKACVELAKKQGAIIASGGGVVKRRKNIEILKETSTILFLDRDVEEIVKDINVQTRPLLKDGTKKVYELYNERYNIYKESADEIVINKGTLEEVTEKSVKAIKNMIK